MRVVEGREEGGRMGGDAGRIVTGFIGDGGLGGGSVTFRFLERSAINASIGEASRSGGPRFSYITFCCCLADACSGLSGELTRGSESGISNMLSSSSSTIDIGNSSPTVCGSNIGGAFKTISHCTILSRSIPTGKEEVKECSGFQLSGEGNLTIPFHGCIFAGLKGSGG